MNGKPFFDTNVLIYAALKNDPRSALSEELLAVGGTVSVQVLNEFVSVARRKFNAPWAEIGTMLWWIRLLCPGTFPLTVETHEQALAIGERYGYRIYDALIIASAMAAKCGVLYSEDLQHGQVIEHKLTILNPFS